MNNKLEKAKQIIDQHYSIAPHGIFDCQNWGGDDMYTVYASDGLVIDICYQYGYFEVFGLSRDEFAELEEYYDDKE